jgi:hypothetical protein
MNQLLTEIFSAVCWFVAFTAAWALLHPKVPTDGLLRTVGTGMVSFAAIVLASRGGGDGSVGTIVLMLALSLIAVDYWVRSMGRTS